MSFNKEWKTYWVISITSRDRWVICYCQSSRSPKVKWELLTNNTLTDWRKLKIKHSKNIYSEMIIIIHHSVSRHFVDLKKFALSYNFQTVKVGNIESTTANIRFAIIGLEEYCLNICLTRQIFNKQQQYKATKQLFCCCWCFPFTNNISTNRG